ncbi:uncharacterized protein LOC126324549 [Schistocerca gregaria]|uniref:uncharacterized protein LOC126324549 n=1 Tax=Schistocerca gregaria TaxID=7010 RepID=UPI00211F3F80|nr:uncharacterized protein LOC126324549 [Schistocerca gregaria]XP_049851023.1 uncharacterized protein LOC126324549 [Schistocerca gregaria]
MDSNANNRINHGMYECPEAPFTVQQLIDTIPKKCFVRSYLKSFGYVLMDLASISALLLLGTFVYYRCALPTYLSVIFWTCYAFAQGTFMTGIWVLAHECGHGAFSPNSLVNDLVGLILHTVLIVPYWSWKFSHNLHHNYTNHLTKDEVFVPVKREQSTSYIPWTTRRVIASIFKHLVLGWPAYLLFNATGNEEREGWVNHFWPWSSLYTSKQRNYVVINDIAITAWILFLWWCGQQIGFVPVLLLYFLPYFVTNAWVVLVTKLQHSSANIPHYSSGAFTWIKGQLCTVDRSYGWLIDSWIHHINDTHIAHHLHPKIPHYNAKLATQALKKKLGPYYQFNDKNLFVQLFESFRDCLYVQEDQPNTGVWWFHYE